MGHQRKEARVYIFTDIRTAVSWLVFGLFLIFCFGCWVLDKIGSFFAWVWSLVAHVFWFFVSLWPLYLIVIGVLVVMGIVGAAKGKQTEKG